MKKIIMIIGTIIITCNVALGVTVCAKNKTYIGILKKDISGTSGTSSNNDKIWAVNFNYTDNVTKTVTGIAACNEVSGTYATPQTNLYTSSADSGEQCWCKMKPVYIENSQTYRYKTGITSYWMFLKTFGDATSCASGGTGTDADSCATACMNAVKTNTAFRSAMYESVW